MDGSGRTLLAMRLGPLIVIMLSAACGGSSFTADQADVDGAATGELEASTIDQTSADEGQRPPALDRAADAGDVEASTDVPLLDAAADVVHGADAGARDASGPPAPEVIGGTFYRSYDGVSGGYTSQGSPATVSTFRLDPYEITVGRFRAFVTAVVEQHWTPAAGSGKHRHLNGGAGLIAVGADAGGFEPGWRAAWNANIAPSDANLECDPSYQTWTTSPGPNEQRPVNCINWYEAYAFCIWDGGFLPTEAEWNYAAAGGAEQREYPWGNGISCTQANYSPSGQPACNAAGPWDVGTASPAGDGKYGQADLAGNVWEWVLDAYGTYAIPCIDCANLGTTTARVIRGGSFDVVAGAATVSYRGNSPPDAPRSANTGARCARSP